MITEQIQPTNIADLDTTSLLELSNRVNKSVSYLVYGIPDPFDPRDQQYPSCCDPYSTFDGQLINDIALLYRQAFCN